MSGSSGSPQRQVGNPKRKVGNPKRKVGNPKRKAVATPPDGGWGWVIVTCSFVNQLLCVGTAMSMGVLYIFWLEEFDEGKAMTSWILSTAFFTMCVIGPLPASLAERYGFKVVTVIGGFLMCLGFSISYFATSVAFLIGSVGIVAGTGMAFIYLSSFATVALYFDKRRTLANGVGTSGAGIGSIVMPLLLKVLEESYGWRGAMLVLAAMILNVCAAGLLLRSLEVKGSNSDSETMTQYDNDSTCKSGSSSDVKNVGLLEEAYLREQRSENGHTSLQHNLSSKDAAFDGEHTEREIPPTPPPLPPPPSPPPHNSQDIKMVDNDTAHVDNNSSRCQESAVNRDKKSQHTFPTVFASSVQHRHITAVVSQFGSAPHVSTNPALSPTPQPPQHSNVFSSANEIRHNRSKKKGERSTVQTRHDKSPQLIVSRSLQNVDAAVIGSMPSLLGKILHPTAAKADDANDVDSITDSFMELEGVESSNMSLTSIRNIDAYIDLLRDKRFLTLASTSVLINWAVTITLVYMAARVVDEGLGTSAAAIVMSFNGMGNVIGRLFFGLVADRYFKDFVVCYILILIILGLATLLSLLCGQHVALHCLFATVFGATLGGNVILQVSVTVALMGLDRTTLALGLNLVFVGIGDLIGPPFGGWLYDSTQSYLYAFLLSGILLLMSAAILIPLRRK